MKKAFLVLSLLMFLGGYNQAVGQSDNLVQAPDIKCPYHGCQMSNPDLVTDWMGVPELLFIYTCPVGHERYLMGAHQIIRSQKLMYVGSTSFHGENGSMFMINSGGEAQWVGGPKPQTLAEKKAEEKEAEAEKKEEAKEIERENGQIKENEKYYREQKKELEKKEKDGDIWRAEKNAVDAIEKLYNDEREEEQLLKLLKKADVERGKGEDSSSQDYYKPQIEKDKEAIKERKADLAKLRGKPEGSIDIDIEVQEKLIEDTKRFIEIVHGDDRKSVEKSVEKLEADLEKLRASKSSSDKHE